MSISKQLLVGAGIVTVATVTSLLAWNKPIAESGDGAFTQRAVASVQDDRSAQTPILTSGPNPEQAAARAQNAGIFHLGDTYDTLASRLQANIDNDPNARALLAEASAQCENLGAAIHSSKAVDDSTREYRAWRAHFCGRARDYDSNRFRTTFATLGDAKQLVNEDGGLVPGKTQQAIDIIVNSKSYADIQTAGDYLMYMPDAQWNIGEARVAGTPMEGKLKELQRTAVESVACIFSGACEAGGLKTMQICAMKRLCAPGVTLYDVWESTYSPQEMAAINDMQRALLNQRNARRTSI